MSLAKRLTRPESKQNIAIPPDDNPNNSHRRFTTSLSKRRIVSSDSSANVKQGSGRSLSGSTTFQFASSTDSFGSSDFDPLRLIMKQKVIFSSMMMVKKPGLMKGWENYYAELRGGVVVLMDPSAKESLKANLDVSHVKALFSCLGCSISLKGSGGATLKVKREGSTDVVVLKFQDASTCDEWEHYLSEAAAVRQVGVQDFEIIVPLSKSKETHILLVQDVVTRELLVMKIIEKREMFKDQVFYSHAVDERLLLELAVNHPFLVQLKFAFQTSSRIFFITNLCEGGNLATHMAKAKRNIINPKSAKRIIAEVIQAIEFIHSKGFIYRDLKPGNVLFDEEGHVRLADFGLAKRLEGGRFNGLTNTQIGGPINTTAPEAMPSALDSQGYGTSVDLWATGIFMYNILSGKTPFQGTDPKQVINNIRDKKIDFSGLDEAAISIIYGLLEQDPSTRLGNGIAGIAGLEKHDFFKDINWDSIKRREPHPDLLNIGQATNVTHAAVRRIRSASHVDGFDIYNPDDLAKVLRNFSIENWMSISLSNDAKEGLLDTKLWPVIKADKHFIPQHMVVGFYYCRGSSIGVSQYV